MVPKFTVQNIEQNGFTFQNTTQLVTGVLGSAGDVSDGLRALDKAGYAVQITKMNSTFGVPPISITKKNNVLANKAAGDAWEADIVNNQLPLTQNNIQTQITVKSAGPSGKRVRLDAVGTDAGGSVRLTDGKASPTAPHTPNQTVVYPELQTHGGTVVGQGKGIYPGGTVIPPTPVDIIRKP